MAMAKCRECSTEVSDSAKVCPKCGISRPVKKTSVVVKILAVTFGLAIFGNVIGTLRGTLSSSSSTNAAQSMSPTPQTLEKQIEAETGSKGQAAQQLGLVWRYNESTEQMGRGTVKHAQVESLNEVVFDFPYRGEQRGTLTLRSHPKYGKDVILSIEKGQFICRIDECAVAVRFDDGKPQNFSAIGPADHSTTSLFIRGHDRFVTAAKKAKRVFIEAQFFQQGTRVFEFEIVGLKW
jgi:hypothetical protein